MSEGMSETDWRRIFDKKRHIERLMEQHTLADVIASDEKRRLSTNPSYPGNRRERRAAARKAAR
jgi:hypothetical protein